MKDRILIFDVAKTLAVVLMIIGHVSSTYDSRGYLAPLSEWIYSFHMPLFMILSGVFFEKTYRKDIRSLLKSKAVLLLVPVVSWSVVSLVLIELLPVDSTDWPGVIKSYVFGGGPLRGLWYLKCLFVYLIVNSLAVKLLKSEFAAMVVTIFLFVLLPDFSFSSIMISFFWIGHFAGRAFREPVKWQWLLIAGVVMVVTWLLWKPEYAYININREPFAYMMNVVTGASASLFWMLLIQKILEQMPAESKMQKWISSPGKLSLGIYVVHIYLYTPELWGWMAARFPVDSILVYLSWSLLILAISLVLVQLLSKNKWTSLFLLGNSVKT